MKLLNRDISWLSFNRRVLDEAEKPIPLQERYMFYGITGSNLDEFLITRYPANLEFEAPEQCKMLKDEIIRHYEDLASSYAGFVAEQKLLIRPSEIHSDLNKKLKNYFRKNIYPTLQPITFDHTETINPRSRIVIFVETADRENLYYNYLEIPDKLPRWIPVDNTVNVYVPIEWLIQDNLEFVFKGMEIKRTFVFRLLRSAEVSMHSDKYTNPYEYIEATLRERMRSWITVVELACEPENAITYMKILRAILNITNDTILLRSNYIKIGDMKKMKGINLPSEELTREYAAVSPFPEEHLFEYIKEKDRLVFHPYESYADTFVRFIEAAASDDNVVSIKISLYRVADHSRIIEALIKAAGSAKQVTVLVELKARFDENHNLKISKILKEAGVDLVYSPLDLKTHAKVCIITRKEEEGLCIYTHIGTGNYNESNAKQYTDYSFFTSNPDIGYDATRFFNLLTSEQEEFKSRKILYAPKNLRSGIAELIDDQISKAKKGNHADILFKCNSLTDDKIAEMLIKAAKEGVRVTLIVRGACVLEPRKNIEIFSLVSHFLEHSRVYIFGSIADNPEVYIGSNDIMIRNLDKRNELMVEISDKSLKNRIIRHMDMYLRDTYGRRRILPNYMYENAVGKEDYDCQIKFFKEARKNAQEG